MNETANSTGQVIINNAWNILVCNKGMACGYQQTGFPQGETPPNFVMPIACGPTVQTQGPGKIKLEQQKNFMLPPYTVDLFLFDSMTTFHSSTSKCYK